jgi:two-component system sensor histidine kinase KdpD
MRRSLKAALWPFAKRSLGGASVIGVITFAGHRLEINALSVSCMYLLTVTLLSLTGDFAAAAVVSVTAFLCMDYFFVQPLYSFRVSDPTDTLALFASLLTALVITRLVSKVRAEARETNQHRQRLERLYRLAQQLLAFEPAPGQFLEHFVGVFGITAVSVFDFANAETRTAGISRIGLPGRTRDAYIMGKDLNDEKASLTVRRFQVEGRVGGAIGFEGLEEPAFTAGPLTALAVTLLDRARVMQQASDASAAAQVEVFRTAVLDALAHEFKTPLTTILAAAGGLRESGALTAEQEELAETVENETTRLGSLTSRLLQTARLDSQNIKPRKEAIDLTALVSQIADQYAGRWIDRNIVVANRNKREEVIADAELLRLPLSQLIENACKYSQLGSTVTIGIDRTGDGVAVRVSNTGSTIPANERRRIFERFYRGSSAVGTTSGSGLGLYVARKIAVAHGGALDLEAADDGVTFCLKIPTPRQEVNDAVVIA